MEKTFGILILILTLTFQSCTEKEDDLISQNCESDCTEIIGKLMTDNATVPIVDRKVTVVWDNTSFGSGVVRTKATARTDSNGGFYLKFFIRDDELEDGLHRMFYDKLDNDEFLSADLNGIPLLQIGRDTMLTRNHNVPKKAFLDLTLLNLNDFQQGDYFWTNFEYIRPVGYSQSIDGAIHGWTNEFDSNQLIELAGNQPIAIEIVREVNDIPTRKNDTLFINAGTTSNYTVDFNN